MRKSSLVSLLLLVLLAPAHEVRAQIPDSLRVDPAPADTLERPREAEAEGITPRGAFLRSLVLPGWGHTEVGSYVRGGFYVATQAATGFMLIKTQTRLSRARTRLDLMEEVVRERLVASGVDDPETLEASVESDPEVSDLQALVDTRSEQREDWIALGIFFLFLGGADAYVSAHLADFPAAVEIEGTPEGGMEVEISIPTSF